MVESSGSTSHAQFQLVVTQALKKTRHENDLPLLKKLKLNAMYLAKTTSTNISDNKTKENLLSLISQLDEAIVDIYNQKNVKVSSDETNDHASTQNKDHTDKEYDFVTTVQQKITTGNSSSTTSALKLQTLIKKQKDLTAQEVEAEMKTQRDVSFELSELTSVLKQATLHIHESVSQQNKDLDSIQHHAGENLNELQAQKAKMNLRSKQVQQSFFASVGSLASIIVAFVLTYIIIRLFPKP